MLRAVPTPQDLPWDPVRLLVTLAVTLLVAVVLVAFPASIVNETIKNNEAEINGWVRRWRRARTSARRRSPVRTFALFAVLAAALMTFIDPRAGLNTDTVVLFTGLLVAVPVVTLAYAVPKELVVRIGSRQRGGFRVLPPGLGLAVALAAVSRLATFVPGYVYGLVATYDPRPDAPGGPRRVSHTTEAIGILAGAAVTLAVAGYAFVRLGQVVPAARTGGADLPLRLEAAGYATIFVLGVQAVVFGLLPLRGMDGGRLRLAGDAPAPGWSRYGWVVLYATACFLFLHTLALNREAALGDPASVPSLARALTIFVVFAVGSFAFRGWFLIPRRPGRLPAHPEAGGA